MSSAVISANFRFRHAKHGVVEVIFEGDLIEVRAGVKVFRQIQNKPRKWNGRAYKMCVTHALEVMRDSLPDEKPPARTEHAKARRKESRPALKLVTTESP